MLISDCCCGSPAPVNIVGSPGLAGNPGASGALVLLGQALANFFQAGSVITSIPINALAYIIKEVVFYPISGDLQGSIGGIYVTNGGVGQLITPYTFALTFPSGQWRTMPLGAAAASGQAALTNSEIYLITTQSTLIACSGYVNVYGYVLA